MIPTSQDCVASTSVILGGHAPMDYEVDQHGESATITLGGSFGVSIATDARGLERLRDLAEKALRDMNTACQQVEDRGAESDAVEALASAYR